MTTTPQPTADDEQRLVEAAGTGDEQAFERLVERHRRELLAHCYRMTGSIHDAEDALQDTLLRAWKGLPRFAGRSSVRTWLYKIATNACLALIQRTGRRTLPSAHDPDTASRRVGAAAEFAWLEPFPYEEPGSPAGSVERRESVELAFIAAAQYLPARQRAVLILRDVMGFSAKEVAALLDTSVPAVTSSLQRARSLVAGRRPVRSQQANLRAIGDHRVAAIVDAYVEAWERRDPAALLAMLTDDATFSMPPEPMWYRGRQAIGRFLVEVPMQHRWRLVPTRASNQLAFCCYIGDNGVWTPHSVDVLTLRDDAIEQITGFLQADLVEMLDPRGRGADRRGMMEGDESVRGTECWRTSWLSRLHAGRDR